MILKEKEVRDLISKNYSKQVKQSSTGNIYNQYEYDERDDLKEEKAKSCADCGSSKCG